MRRERGFCVLIAPIPGRRTCPPWVCPLSIKDTPAQSARDRQQRLVSVKDAFAVDPLLTLRIRGKRIVLVDDVMTSGASMFAAAIALRAAGAMHITGMVVARTE